VFDELIVSGGDERLDLDADGRNKYHVDPRSSTTALHRGSCTNSPLTDTGRSAATAAHRQLIDGDLGYDEWCAQQRRRLLDVFVPGEHRRAGVFFAPSGSDLCYLPLLMASLWSGSTRLRNVVTTSEELGSGSLAAHDGRFYAARSQLGETPSSAAINTELDVEPIYLSAREHDGSVVDHGRRIESIITQRTDDRVLVINLVIGSKSGIENGIDIVERFSHADVVWTVDLCQMRVRPDLVERLLDLGCLLFTTGSKFYQAPPFCGAMLIPDVWLDRISTIGPASLSGFDRLFSAQDVPREWPTLRALLPSFENVGLRLRWEAALAEIEAFDAVPDPASAAVMDRWNRTVVDRIDASPRLELLRDQEHTNDSIVSFRARSAEGAFLDRAGLAEIHRRLAVVPSPEIAPFDRAFIGQPVSYESGSFLRFAIGSRDVRRWVASGFDRTADRGLIAATERIAGDLS